MNDYLIAWHDGEYQRWEIVSGGDAMQERVDDIARIWDLSVDDIVVGEITENTR